MLSISSIEWLNKYHDYGFSVFYSFVAMNKNEYIHFLKPGFNFCHPQWSTLEEERQTSTYWWWKSEEINKPPSEWLIILWAPAVCPYLRVSSLQCGSCSPLDNRSTPESPGWLWLKSSSLRWDGLDIRAEAREMQPFSVIIQPERLQTHTRTKVILVYYQHHWLSLWF